MDSSGGINISWPEEDGFVEQLDLLDEQLAAWAEAVRGANQTLRQMAAAAASPEPVVVEDREAVTATGNGPALDSAASHVQLVTAQAELEEPGSELPADEPEVAPLDAHTRRGQQATATPRTGDSDEQPVVGTPELHDPGEEADTTLLDSLDPNAVSWIRVRQRLSAQPRSARELLGEYEANKRTQKKRWWPGTR